MGFKHACIYMHVQLMFMQSSEPLDAYVVLRLKRNLREQASPTVPAT